MYRKATAEEREGYQGIYPLHGRVIRKPSFDVIDIEDLRGSWENGDPQWEVLAPYGFHFGGEFSGMHTVLCESLAEAKDIAKHEPLTPCTDKC